MPQLVTEAGAIFGTSVLEYKEGIRELAQWWLMGENIPDRHLLVGPHQVERLLHHSCPCEDAV